MYDVLRTITPVINELKDWMTSFLTSIAETPLLLLFVTLPILGLAVGFIKRIIRL